MGTTQTMIYDNKTKKVEIILAKSKKDFYEQVKNKNWELFGTSKRHKWFR